MIHQATRLEVASRNDRAGAVQVTQDRSWAAAKAEGQVPHLDGEGDRRGRELVRDWTNPLTHTRPSSTKTLTSLSARSHSEMSPPLTPRGSRQAFGAAYEEEPEATFHNYLRAFYHFHPSSTVSSSGDESSITVPINQGDVILVHSVHPNGWADGTLLGSGARGWLPTNYCEPYDHPSVRNLLTALTHLWDLVRSNEHETLVVFSRQDYVRGMIAGVRFFLEQTSCLSRDSTLIVNHVGLRRLRKGLLGDLSTLVRIAKQLQDTLQNQQPQSVVYELMDELVLKAFKVVTRAVRFLDIWSQDVNEDLAQGAGVEFPQLEYRPLTPPVDSANEAHEVQPVTAMGAEDHGEAGAVSAIAVTESGSMLPLKSLSAAPVVATIEYAQRGVPVADLSQISPKKNRTSLNRHSQLSPVTSVFSQPRQSNIYVQGPSQSPQLASRPLSVTAKRISVSHRSSYISKGGGVKRQNLASERLSAAHDSFLGLLGTFIGLHLQSRSSHELAATTQQSVVACRQLLAVVEEVWARDGRRSDSLQLTRDVMYASLAELVQATKDMFTWTQSGEEVLNPDQGRYLVMTTTSCIRAAGDCVSKARQTIERIGDFEFEYSTSGLSDQVFEALSQNAHAIAGAEDRSPSNRCSSSLDKPLPIVPSPPEPSTRPPLPPLVLTTDSKPLPEPPQLSPLIPEDSGLRTMLVDSPDVHSLRSSRSSITPQPIAIPQLLQTEHSPTDSTDSSQSLQTPASEFVRLPRTDSVNTSAADTASSWRNSMPDGASTVSIASTRATTPDRSPVHQSGEAINLGSFGSFGSFGSVSELQSTISEESGVEEQVLEKTFAHELIHNKEGQVIGGSLPALIERLTTHDTTPDATFVTTFYLTFRLFTTPTDFAHALIERFDYIGDTQTVGVPVRLRVYNVFKGWLESHWQPESDVDALPIISEFAMSKLSAALPSAGKRIFELATKVSDLRDGALVPRLVSSLGKTSTSVTVFSAADSQIPTPNVTKSQLNSLRQARVGSTVCGILDFDPLEMARQFTIMESRIFCSIGPEELLALEWTKKAESRAINVRAMSTLSTDLANLVADTILQLEETKKRAVIIKQWVKVAMKCLELNNYDSLMAIICSLNSSMVTRLKKTWELVSQKTKTRLEDLCAIVDVGKNYAVLRERLKNHVAPCIPFVGLYLTDLTFVTEGNPESRELPGYEPKRSVVNFDRYMKTAKVIGQLQRFQVPYRLAAVPEMQEWMEGQIQRVRESDGANVQNYYRRSLLLEPREQSAVPARSHWYNNQPQQMPTQQRQQPEGLGEREGHSSKESVGGMSVKDKFDLLGSLHIGRERVGSQ